jgi:parvulin-like peptidyl-prolyl isomerase
MRAHFRIAAAALSAGLYLLAACRQEQPRTPPPDAERPIIKNEAELRKERDERIRAGQITPTSAPVLVGESRLTAPRSTPPPAPQPAPGAIQADILMVNNQTLTVAEVLYPIRGELAEIRKTQTAGGFRERARQIIRREAQRNIGALLIYAEAMSGLEDKQKEVLDKELDKELANIAAQDYGGSSSRMAARLAEWGLTKEQFRDALKRDLVVRQYTREKLMPQVQIRRDELLAYYRRNVAQYETAESRELLMIELPYDQFLADGVTWDRASRQERAAAKLAAVERARQAHALLAQRPFEEVAREMSHGSHAGEGGSWGLLTRPLQAPYDKVSAKLFELSAGQYTEPVEGEHGWYIVGCGKIEPASQQSFADVQNDIRRELMERRFQKLSTEYVLKLAANATISSLDLFIGAGLKRAEELIARKPAEPPVAGGQ